MVRIAFRCALLVDRIARTLDTFDPESTAKNWIYVLLNESEQTVRDELENAQPSSVSLFWVRALVTKTLILVDPAMSANNL